MRVLGWEAAGWGRIAGASRRFGNAGVNEGTLRQRRKDDGSGRRLVQAAHVAVHACCQVVERLRVLLDDDLPLRDGARGQVECQGHGAQGAVAGRQRGDAGGCCRDVASLRRDAVWAAVRRRAHGWRQRRQFGLRCHCLNRDRQID